MTRDECVDCLEEGITTRRPLAQRNGKPAPGPRCVTHDRRERRRLARRASERRVLNTYEMPPEVYDQILEAQGGRCAICRIANGTSKRLAVEHKHNLEGCEHPPEKGCRRCWRGICCGRCNELLGRFTPEALLRAVHYFANPPAQRILERIELAGEGFAVGADAPERMIYPPGYPELGG